MTEFEDRELIDIYSEDRQSKGYKKPRHGEGSKLLPDEYMIYALGLIENRSGKFLITRRTLDKKWAAGAWEIPGGGASAGETSMDAVKREVYEETGIDLGRLEPLSVYSYKNSDPDGGDNYFCDIYHFRVDFEIDDVDIQPEEVSDYRLSDFSEMKKLYGRDGFLHFKRITEALDAE
jgi:8-oxo-dGTP diphosphatase